MLSKVGKDDGTSWMFRYQFHQSKSTNSFSMNVSSADVLKKRRRKKRRKSPLSMTFPNPAKTEEGSTKKTNIGKETRCTTTTDKI